MQKFLAFVQHPNTLAVVIMLLFWVNTPSAWKAIKNALRPTPAIAPNATAAKQVALPPRDALIAQYVQCTGKPPDASVPTKDLNDIVWECNRRRQGRSV
jgi:hypothetical protein